MPGALESGASLAFPPSSWILTILHLFSSSSLTGLFHFHVSLSPCSQYTKYQSRAHPSSQTTTSLDKSTPYRSHCQPPTRSQAELAADMRNVT